MDPSLLLLCISQIILIVQVSAQTLPSCNSKVYCQGQLLHTVQMARLFNDSKEFVDMKMINDETTTLKNFETFFNNANQNPTKDQVREFVNANFETVSEFDDWTPEDFKQDPKFLSLIVDAEVKQFAQDVVNIWPELSRKVKQDVIDNAGLYTLLPVKNGFIIPGGRFREFYYWDSYWIIKGLLLSEMYDTVRGMLDNFLYIVDKYGFLPNGARIYYLNRSQPPLLNLMVADYISATNDLDWLAANIKTLDKELRFWLDNKVVTVNKNNVKYELAHYDSESGSPRPESYYEDVKTASSLPTQEDQVQLYADIKSSAESGWDFSSRWIVDKNGGNNANLTFLKTRRIIPVDLNAFLCQAFRKLSEFYSLLTDIDNTNFWLEKSKTWEQNIEAVLYDDTDGIWYDWDSILEQPRRYFYPSNFAPLWSLAYDQLQAEKLGENAAMYFEKSGIMNYKGGIPASTSATGEQWDYPNAWPPLQAIVILGLDRSGNCKAKNISKEFAERWVQANKIGFSQTEELFEKYDAETPGKYGGGGEYVIQSGFGWTNGVVLEFINRFYTASKSTDSVSII